MKRQVLIGTGNINTKDIPPFVQNKTTIDLAVLAEKQHRDDTIRYDRKVQRGLES